MTKLFFAKLLMSNTVQGSNQRAGECKRRSRQHQVVAHLFFFVIDVAGVRHGGGAPQADDGAGAKNLNLARQPALIAES